MVLGRGRLLADLAMQDFLGSRSRPRVRVRTTESTRLRDVLIRKGYESAQGDDGRWTVEGAKAGEIGAIVVTDGIPVLELIDEQATLEQACLDLTSDAMEFAAAATSRDPAMGRIARCHVLKDGARRLEAPQIP
ncbi:hypothetical protein OG315_35285 [Streptomyces atratus]|nr:hypothetical protein [Streptomyces atratus]MCX5345008.1 hypothetical protein [Streptomyces atratus]